MQREFPEAEVRGYEHSSRPWKMTEGSSRRRSNLKDIVQLTDGVEAQWADEFLCNLFDLDPQTSSSCSASYECKDPFPSSE